MIFLPNFTVYTFSHFKNCNRMFDILSLAFQLLLFLVIAWSFMTFLFSPQKSFGNIFSRWHHSFEFSFSTQEFYDAVEEAIKAKEVDAVSMDRVTHLGKLKLFSSKRLYLQIRRQDTMILVCAAPFGNGFFVSWWAGEPFNFWKDYLPRVPKIGPAIAVWLYGRTFYEMDTDSMFKDFVQGCVVEVINRISESKGMRGLPELSKPVNMPLHPTAN